MTFGPFYPPAMLGAVSHAESLCDLLTRLEVRPGRLAARAWLHGRGQEIECFVRQLASDFRSGRLSAVAAASALDAYLDALHRGMAKHFGERSPECCRASSAATAIAGGSSDSAPTTAYRTGRRFQRHVTPAFEEIHTDELLAGLPTRVGR